MSKRDRRAPGEGRLGPASRAFLQMSEGEATLESEEVSRGRKVVALGLAVLTLLAVPVLWFTAGPGSDQAVAVIAGKSDDDDNSGPGGGDDDNSGPGGGDDSTGDDSVSVTASATSTGNRETAGTTRGEATTKDGTATTKRGSTRGTTRGEPSTRVTTTGTSRGTDSTKGTTRGATTK